jgi:hypothetical protein
MTSAASGAERRNMPIQYAMTVQKLREQLSRFPDDTNVVVLWEDEEMEQHLFGIDHIALQSGTPRRDSEQRAGFTFEKDGPSTWLFISISPE